jgi:hypothetical protein
MGFTIYSEGAFWYNGRICVANVEDLKQIIMRESHDTPYSIHPKGTKMFKTSRNNYGGTV